MFATGHKSKVQAAVKDVSRKLTAARTAVILDTNLPFFASLILRLKLVADPTCRTAWVDGRSIGYNPAFVDSLSHDVLVATLAHEVMHPALGHNWRRDGREHGDWNIACDKPINSILRDAGFTLPEKVYYCEGDEEGKSAEWIYARMQEQKPEPDKPEPGDEPGEDGEPGNEPGDEDGEEGDGAGDGDEEGDEDGEPGDGDSEGHSDGGAKGKPGKPNPMGEVRDAPTGPDEEGDPAPTEQEWKEAVAVAAVQAEAMGKLPGGLRRMVEKALKPQIDPRALLLRFFSERATGDYTWTRPNVRYIAMGQYLPALYSEALGHVAIVNDTSGSRGDVAMDHARKIVESVIEECNPATVTLYHADADVARVDRVERGEALEWEAEGGGGTDFRPALAAIEDEGTAVCAVYITDMWGTFPEVPPPFPVFWLSTSEDIQAPFGETVYVGDC